MKAKAFVSGIALTLATATAAQEPEADRLRIIGGTVPHVLHPEIPGPHNYILEKILPEVAVGNAVFSTLPYARALRDFKAQLYDCLYATTNNPVYFDQALVADGTLIFSEPVNTLALRAFTRAGEPFISSWQDLYGKTLVGTLNQLRGIRARLSDDEAQFITVVNAEKAFELLEKGRANVAMVYGMDAYLTVAPGALIEQNTAPTAAAKFAFDAGFAPIEWGEIMVCWNGPQSQPLMAAFNSEIGQLREDGLLENLFALGEN